MQILRELSKRERAHNERVLHTNIGYKFEPRIITVFTSEAGETVSNAGIRYSIVNLRKMRRINGVGRPPVKKIASFWPKNPSVINFGGGREADKTRSALGALIAGSLYRR